MLQKSDLRFRDKKLYKAAREIQEIAEKSTLFIAEESNFNKICDEVDPAIKPREKEPVISRLIYLVPKKELENKLNELFGKEETGDNQIKYHWFKECDSDYEHIDVWSLKIWGREICDNYLSGLQNDTFDYDSCPCPKEFSNYCKKVNSILRKHSYNF
jgi:hypothetical protein